MTTTIKGFFFDLDGTLVDTHESNFRAYRQAVNETTGDELGDELKDRIKNGETSESFLRALLPDASDAQVDAINKKKKEFYPEHLGESTLNEYLSSFLAQMSEHYVTALVTTAKRVNAEAVLDAHNIKNLFDFKVFGDDVDNMKPSPDAYLLALEKAELSPEEVIAFEDSEKGIQAATSAGIKTVHIRNFV